MVCNDIKFQLQDTVHDVDIDACYSNWTQTKHDYDIVVEANRGNVVHDVRFHVCECTWKCSNHVAGNPNSGEQTYDA